MAIDNLNQLQGLLEKISEPFIFMEKTLAPDGGGGFITTWREGETFNLAFSNDLSTETLIAQAQGVNSVFTLAVPLGVPLKFNDYIKRVSDGVYFRITNDPIDMTAPRPALNKHRQFRAERIRELPTQ